ncbi:hypothetical protein K501DRAFT_310217 [Backusella circina FSU 941]|nr:hypothetical protein K501DRAFT_310217 [Backusella circina FSU 941]
MLVVHHPTTRMSKTINRDPTEQEMVTDRISIINDKRMNDGISQRSSEFLNKKVRDTTQKSYDYGWRVCYNYYTNNKLNPVDITPQQVLNFRESHTRLSWRTLTIYCSAISSAYIEYFLDIPPLADHRYIMDFLEALRETQALKDWRLTETISLEALQQKTLILVGTATMWRPRSNLDRLQFQNVSLKFQDNQLIGVRLVSKKPKESKIQKVSRLRS